LNIEAGFGFEIARERCQPAQFLQSESVVATSADGFIVRDHIDVQEDGALLSLLPCVYVVVRVKWFFGGKSPDNVAAGLVHLKALSSEGEGRKECKGERRDKSTTRTTMKQLLPLGSKAKDSAMVAPARSERRVRAPRVCGQGKGCGTSEGRSKHAQQVDVDWRLGEHDVGGGHGEAVHVARARGGHLAQQRAGDGRGVGAACGGGVESSRRGVELRDRG
jgi:hypothetical protein